MYVIHAINITHTIQNMNNEPKTKISFSQKTCISDNFMRSA